MLRSAYHVCIMMPKIALVSSFHLSICTDKFMIKHLDKWFGASENGLKNYLKKADDYTTNISHVLFLFFLHVNKKHEINLVSLIFHTTSTSRH